jgi:hypothetical protein
MRVSVCSNGSVQRWPKCKQHLILNNFRDRPAGTLRLNVPSSAARLVLPAIVPAFLAAYPDIRLEVIAEESFVDVLAAGCDAGIRCEEILEQGMIAVPKPGGRALPAHSGRCLVPPPLRAFLDFINARCD